MITLFVIGILVFTGKLISFAIKAAWGLTKGVLFVIGIPALLIAWAVSNNMEVVYIQHNNLSAGTRTFKPGTHGAGFVPELNVVSDHIFTKTKSNALTSEEFAAFIRECKITEFYIAGADATACIKSTCYNLAKAGYAVHVLSDCITSYDKKKLPEMLEYYAGKGCAVEKFSEIEKNTFADNACSENMGTGR